MKTKTKTQLKTQFFLTAALCAVLWSGCTPTTTYISSEPAGASLSIDGVPVGKTPLEHTDANVWLWTRRTLIAKKPGHFTVTRVLAAQPSLKGAPFLIVAYVCCFPLAFLALQGDFPPTVFIPMQRKEADSVSLSDEADFTIDFAQ